MKQARRGTEAWVRPFHREMAELRSANAAKVVGSHLPSWEGTQTQNVEGQAGGRIPRVVQVVRFVKVVGSLAELAPPSSFLLLL